MSLSYNVEKLLTQRYYKPGESWNNLVDRVVSYVCQGEEVSYKNAIYQQIRDRIWLPNSPALANAGTRNSGLMACYVVGPDRDSLEHHVEVLGDIAAVGKRGGGAGFTGANIRAEGSIVSGSTHGYAYGPNNWALRVSDYLDMITQNGLRKMALMYSLPSEHPDLDDFIKLKHNGNEKFAYNFNQSVFASDKWMKEANGQLDEVARRAWMNGEPGLLFADTIQDNTPYQTCGCLPETVNPCGEQPLSSYGSCNLASINLNHEIFYDNKNNFNFTILGSIVNGMVRFMDNVGHKNVFPNNKFKAWYEKHRPIGIGIMGYADALLRLGYAYGEQDSLDFLSDVMKTIQFQSYKASEKLGQERGVPEHCRAVNRRNITTVSIAPTGSIAFIAECSHGIEPVFSPIYQRTDERGETYILKHPQRDDPHFKSSINSIKERMPTWREHIDVQATAQVHTDSGVSKTINLVNGSTPETVKEAMLYAWESGGKGITVYRDGSRQTQVLEELTEDEEGELSCPSGVCLV
jgi:ribonucleoside-diphosphate reductase alpha chain